MHLSEETTQEKTVFKGLSFCAFAADGNLSEIDVANGRIVRIRPFHYDKQLPSADLPALEDRSPRQGISSLF